LKLRTVREFLNITSARDKTRAAICSAIKSRRVIEFYYHGGFRTAEPFCLGVVMSGEADNESLLCYQIGGHSEYGNTVGWKLYRASEISDLVITRERFNGDRPGYDPDNLEMATVYCSVSIGADAEYGAEETGKPHYETPRKQAAAELTHNELMRRFRFTHPIPLTELYTNIIA
jgi:hypothetical protein